MITLENLHLTVSVRYLGILSPSTLLPHHLPFSKKRKLLRIICNGQTLLYIRIIDCRKTLLFKLMKIALFLKTILRFYHFIPILKVRCRMSIPRLHIAGTHA